MSSKTIKQARLSPYLPKRKRPMKKQRISRKSAQVHRYKLPIPSPNDINLEDDHDDVKQNVNSTKEPKLKAKHISLTVKQLKAAQANEKHRNAAHLEKLKRRTLAAALRQEYVPLEDVLINKYRMTYYWCGGTGKLRSDIVKVADLEKVLPLWLDQKELQLDCKEPQLRQPDQMVEYLNDEKRGRQIKENLRQLHGPYAAHFGFAYAHVTLKHEQRRDMGFFFAADNSLATHTEKFFAEGFSDLFQRLEREATRYIIDVNIICWLDLDPCDKCQPVIDAFDAATKNFTGSDKRQFFIPHSCNPTEDGKSLMMAEHVKNKAVKQHLTFARNLKQQMPLR